METENAIIQMCAGAVAKSASDVLDASALFTDNNDENNVVVASLNVELDALRSHIVLLQQKLDSYSG